MSIVTGSESSSHAAGRVLQVPFFRPQLTAREVHEVVDTLRSGWLTTGPRAKQFEAAFAKSVNARHAVSVNSCTAALHLAVEALGLKAGQGVLVPTMTFAATAEVVRYQGGIPILVDCDPATNLIDLEDAERKLQQFTTNAQSGSQVVVGIMPVHVGGLMLSVNAIAAFARRHRLWIVEDAAHAFPAAWRETGAARWQQCGEDTATVTCFSFYANKTITTGEGGMAVTGDDALAQRMRLMSLHGLSHDAWDRYATGGHWDYRIIAAGFKYNLTDVAAAIGIHQLARAEAMRLARQRIATIYRDQLADEALDVPPIDANRIHSWHLFPIQLRLGRLSTDRDRFISELRDAGITTSVHWRPLHLHPYYANTFGLTPEACPNATRTFERLVSLPVFPGMTNMELEYVISSVKRTLRAFAR
jgi:dTDP-4-amino-4,6-dideoxygalactose transaminase